MKIKEKMKLLYGSNMKSIYFSTLIGFSIFFSIVTMSMFFVGGAGFESLLMGVLFFALIYFFITKALLKFYKYLLNRLVLILDKKEMKFNEQNTSLVWLLPSIICGMGSILIFIISSYYIQLEINTLGNIESFLAIVSNIVSTYIAPLVVVFVLFGFIIQLYILNKLENIRLHSSLFSSVITISIFILIFWFTRRLLVGLIGFLG